MNDCLVDDAEPTIRYYRSPLKDLADYSDPDLFDALTFDATLATYHTPKKRIPLFRSALQTATEILKQRFLSGVLAADLVPQRAWLIDQLLYRAWTHLETLPSHDVALVAVGGYGRGELHPGSDIDLLILVGTHDRDSFYNEIERFIVCLWDIGLEVGHSVRSLEECVSEATNDVTVATNLMEARLIAGPKPLFEALKVCTGPEQVWPSDRFFFAKRREQRARHAKFDDTAYNLEPNVKGSPGGLRDIQMIGWVAKRHFGAKTLHGLVDHEFLTEAEYDRLIAGQNFLWQVRFGLHSLTGRKEDRLLFDYQKTLATQFGFHDNEHSLAVEKFMQRYYRVVNELSRLNEMLLQLFEEVIEHPARQAAPVPLNTRFQVHNDFIEVVDDKVFRDYPSALLEMFLLLAQHPQLKGVRAGTIRLVRDHCHLIDEAFRRDPQNRALFMALLRQPRGITHELRRMSRYGVLGAYLPAFGQVVGQMQYDLFHVYTVDEHSLFVVRNLRRFAIPKFSQELPLCSELFKRIAKPALLYLAALFHDLAKGRGGDHSELGAQDAEVFCLEHGLSPVDARLVAWLVRHHLNMSLTAQRKDISDPEIINQFAARIGDRVRLDHLYLLTVADIRATNPPLWNSWKDALLTELYHATWRALRRGLENPVDKQERVAETQHEAHDLLRGRQINPKRLDALLSSLGDDYFLRYSANEIAWHTDEIIKQGNGREPLVLMRQETKRGGTEIFVFIRDQDHLFALITSVLDQMGLTIVDARIITADSGCTLDTYTVLEESGEPISGEARSHEILTTLQRRLIQGDATLTPVSRRTPREIKYFPTKTQVQFSIDGHNQRTIMEVIATDQPGLLSRIGQAMLEHGIRLQNAKIATIGARAEDIFFITDRQGNPLRDQAVCDALRQSIIQYVNHH